MSAAESHLEETERHIREAKAHIARQEKIVAELERDNHVGAAERARRILTTLRETLAVAQEHRRIIIEKK